jgi:hypothetical protein
MKMNDSKKKIQRGVFYIASATVIVFIIIMLVMGLQAGLSANLLLLCILAIAIAGSIGGGIGFFVVRLILNNWTPDNFTSLDNRLGVKEDQEEITLTFDINWDDLIAIRNYYISIAFKLLIIFNIITLIVLFILLTIIMIFQLSGIPAIIAFISLFVLLFLLLITQRKSLIKKEVNKTKYKYRYLIGKHSLKMTGAFLCDTTETSTVTYYWNNIEKLTLIESHLVISTTGFIIIIPKSAFQDEVSFKHFVETTRIFHQTATKQNKLLFFEDSK